MKRAIVVAMDLNPEIGSECGKAHRWLTLIARHYHVDVFVPVWHRQGIMSARSAYPLATFHFMCSDGASGRLLRRVRVPPLVNALFVRSVKRRLESTDLREYGLIHVLTPAGVHSFNDLYTLGIPIVAGPLGGALPTHPGFGDVFKDERLKNALRDAYYRLVPAFHRLLREQGGDLEAFYREVAALAKLSKDERHRRLQP